MQIKLFCQFFRLCQVVLKKEENNLAMANPNSVLRRECVVRLNVTAGLSTTRAKNWAGFCQLLSNLLFLLGLLVSYYEIKHCNQQQYYHHLLYFLLHV